MDIKIDVFIRKGKGWEWKHQYGLLYPDELLNSLGYADQSFRDFFKYNCPTEFKEYKGGLVVTNDWPRSVPQIIKI